MQGGCAWKAPISKSSLCHRGPTAACPHKRILPSSTTKDKQSMHCQEQVFDSPTTESDSIGGCNFLSG
uniref:Uncharacterized protein n=1 Tax=Nelumbo nucifera TaxID=4432 RepID=A0A822Y2T1_NELNU|nr:TPA_asm: hypothetical protein HUJ06_026829 [Nelumbo nucifera]